MNKKLKQLKESTTLHELAGFSVNSDALRILLCRLPEVEIVSKSLRSEEVSELSIRKFVQEVLEDFQSGESLFGDIALAAIAVVLEPIQLFPESFAEKYLRDLSRIQLAEINISPRVANACLRARSQLIMSHERTKKVPESAEEVAEAWVVNPAIKLQSTSPTISIELPDILLVDPKNQNNTTALTMRFGETEGRTVDPADQNQTTFLIISNHMDSHNAAA